MSNNKPHFSYINVSLLVLSNHKIVFLKKLVSAHSQYWCALCITCGTVYNIYFWRVQKMDLMMAMFLLVPSVTSKIWISRWVESVVDIKLRSYSFVSRIRTLVKTLRHHVTILDLFRTLLDPSYYMIHINIVLVKIIFPEGTLRYNVFQWSAIRSQL